MGTVYEAEQDQPRRTVALKIIKPGISTPELQRRFEQESQALGRLQHPGNRADLRSWNGRYRVRSAAVLRDGTHPRQDAAGYAKEHHLNTRQRLEMVARIAEAVQHAHRGD